MARKLALVLALLVVALPGLVQALGLGEIKLDSYLNQPLEAEIKLISASQGELEGLRVSLASPADFARVGLDFQHALRKLNFKVIKKADGSYIKVTTRESIREPFLNFLLEVNWSKGRILREYTLLIDPPTLVQAAVPVTTAPVASTPKPPVPAPAPAASQDDRFPRFGVSEPADSGRGIIGDTYKVQRKDTTWTIAQKVRPDSGVSMEQVMLALLKSNPQAFMGDNINRLKSGYDLAVPDREVMTSLSHAEALAEVRRQNRDWREGRKSPSTSVAASQTKGKLEILPPKMDEKPGKGGQAAMGASTEDAGQLHREALLAKEAAEAQRQENSELRMRISELEAQIKNVQRLATMKDEQLAALQKKLGELQGSESEPAPVVAEPASVAEEAKEPKPAEEPESIVAAAPKEIVEAKVAEQGAPINQHVVGGFKPVDLEALPKDAAPAKPFKTEAAPAAAQPVVEESTVDFIKNYVKGYFEKDPMIAWVATGAVGILLLLVILLIIQRRKAGSQFEESILQERTPESSSAAMPAAAAAATSGIVTEEIFEEEEKAEPEEPAEEVESSFVSDLVISDMSDLQAEGGEADPLTEADVFLAYGRFGPAENMIKEAITKEPERNDLKVKLLEIYYSAKNREAFENEARNFQDYLKDNPDQESWDKVAEMGEDLCPDSALFSVSEENEAVETEETVADSGVESENALNLGEVSGAEGEDTDILDFDLGEFESQLESLGVEKDDSEINEDLDGLDLDLDLDSIQNEEEDSENGEDPTLAMADDLEEIADSLSEESHDEAALEEQDFSFDTIEESDMASDDTQELDLRDLTADIDLGDIETVEEEIPAAESVDADMSDIDDLDLDDDVLGDLDEVGTKLDLAKAYIDMGDPDGARSILEEVLEEGNDNQKSEAEDLMKQIA